MNKLFSFLSGKKKKEPIKEDKVVQELNSSQKDNKSKVAFSENVVEINSFDKEKKVTKGYYYNKYIDQLQKMYISNPIFLSSEGNKICMKEDSLVEFVNDLGLLYKKSIEPVELNQIKIETELKFTNELLKTVNLVYSDQNLYTHLDIYNKEANMMRDIDQLDTTVDNLNDQLDFLEKEFEEMKVKYVNFN